jgi:hypothetical protein
VVVIISFLLVASVNCSPLTIIYYRQINREVNRGIGKFADILENISNWPERGGPRSISQEISAAGARSAGGIAAAVIEIPMERLSEEDQQWIRKRGR